MSADAAVISARVRQVWQRIEAAGGSQETVRLVAVTKTFGADVVRAGIDAGLTDFGENYAHEIEQKAAAVPGARWHFLGSIQRRKVRHVAPFVSMWHGVDRVEEGLEISRHAPEARVLVQVDLSGEATKAGCDWDEAPDLVQSLLNLGLDVAGLMGIGPLAEPEAARPHFRRLAQLSHDLGLAELSMGMSSDLEVAIEEGATIVRIGTAIFGSRTARR